MRSSPFQMMRQPADSPVEPGQLLPRSGGSRFQQAPFVGSSDVIKVPAADDHWARLPLFGGDRQRPGLREACRLQPETESP